MQRGALLLAGACFWHWGGCCGVCKGICRMAGRACNKAGRRIWGLPKPSTGLPWPAPLRQAASSSPACSGQRGWSSGWTGTGDPAVALMRPEDLLSCSEAAVASPAPRSGWGGPGTPRSWVHAVAQPWQHHHRLRGAQGLVRVASAGRCQAGGRAGTPRWGHIVLHTSFPSQMWCKLGVPPRCAP